MKIHDAARRGDILDIAKELSAGVPVDAREVVTQFTTLQCACSTPVTGAMCIRFLIKQGSEVSREVFDTAVQNASIEVLETLIQFGAIVDGRPRDGCGSLAQAVYGRGDPDNHTLLPVLKFLFAHGAHPSIETQYGESALNVASHRGRFDAVQLLLDAGANPYPLKWTELMYAVALGTDEHVQGLVDRCESLTDRDGWERTPWLLSLQAGSIAKAEILLDSGANLNDVGCCKKPAVQFAVDAGNPELITWLAGRGVNVDASDEFSTTALHLAVETGRLECCRALFAAGANPNAPMPFGVCAIDEAPDMELTRMLAEGGARLRQISPEARLRLAGGSGGDPEASLEQYQSGRQPVFGKFNGQPMLSPFWRAMVRSGCNAYTARAAFSDTEYKSQPVWCYDRFGRSSTLLPDGRVIEIGGEHEDGSDPDFCIYNDVVVFDGKRDFQIVGYPESVFPPTDFHTATLVGEHIYIIGCLGYPKQRRPRYTPVYRLSTKSWEMERIETCGDNPGWIWGHNAEYRAADHSIAVYQSDEKGQSHSDFAARRLDLKRLTWSPLT